MAVVLAGTADILALHVCGRMFPTVVCSSVVVVDDRWVLIRDGEADAVNSPAVLAATVAADLLQATVVCSLHTLTQYNDH